MYNNNTGNCTHELRWNRKLGRSQCWICGWLWPWVRGVKQEDTDRAN